MANAAPPERPLEVAVGDRDPADRVRFRLWQISMTALTLVITGWFCSLGVVPALIALFLTKHILVAILAMGLHLPADHAS